MSAGCGATPADISPNTLNIIITDQNMTPQDKTTLEEKGIAPELLESQLKRFETGFPISTYRRLGPRGQRHTRS